MTLPVINFQATMESLAGDPVMFLGTEPSVFVGIAEWYTISIFVPANVVPGVDSGWETTQVDEHGVLRSDIEALIPPVPVAAIRNKVLYVTVSLFPYKDEAIHYIRGIADIDDAPQGHMGLIEVKYGYLIFPDGSRTIVSATVEDIISPT